MTQPDKWDEIVKEVFNKLLLVQQTEENLGTAWSKQENIIAAALRDAEKAGMERAGEHKRERLEVALHKIITRATPYPDDTDQDRRRNLHNILSIAKDAIRAAKETKE
jgi:hypothetical protein